MKPKAERPKLKFLHLRSENGKGTVTIGFEVNYNSKTVRWTKARCAPWDNFCRRIGRRICEGRFMTNGTTRSNGTVRAFVKEFTFEGEAHQAHVAIKAVLIKHHPDYIETAADTSKSEYTASRVGLKKYDDIGDINQYYGG